jgi:uncharacterized membrane protein YphA (DoxX/SURF4 family)
MNATPSKLESMSRATARAWNAFFHQPCDARICAAIRIAYASLVLIHLAVLFPDLDHWFTDAGVLPLAQSQKINHPTSWTLLALLPQTSTAIHACFWITVGHAVALLVGLLPRLNALMLVVWLLSFQVANDVILDAQDTLMRIIGFFVIWLPGGHSWSVNALVRKWWLRRRAPITPLSAKTYSAPGWGLRLLQIEMAAMFLSTGMAKASTQSWRDGIALYYVSRLDDMFGRLSVPHWIFETPWVVAVLTWSVMLVELSVPLLIWFRKTRLPCLVAVLVFHLGNEWMMNLFLFHPLMLCGWIAFLKPDDFRWLRRKTPTGDGSPSSPKHSSGTG